MTTVADLRLDFRTLQREQIYFFYEALRECDDILYIHDCLVEFNVRLRDLRKEWAHLDVETDSATSRP